MKKLALGLFMLVASVTAFTAWVFVNISPVGNIDIILDFNVAKGENASIIAASLYEKKLIRNPEILKAYLKLTGMSSSIQAGNYKISPSMSMFKVVEVLTSAPNQIKVTIPEGYTNSEIADKFAKALNQGKSFTNEFTNLAKNDQGYLFPDTYLISENTTPAVIVAKMKQEFIDKTDSLKPTPSQIVMASIIEKETKGKEERPVVAGILMNRLESGMPLQVDVAPETYERIGLPNSPIANPGLVSINAAVHPVATDYWYYLHDSTGTIHYAKTLDEQNVNIKKYLRK